MQTISKKEKWTSASDGNNNRDVEGVVTRQTTERFMSKGREGRKVGIGWIRACCMAEYQVDQQAQRIGVVGRHLRKGGGRHRLECTVTGHQNRVALRR